MPPSKIVTANPALLAITTVIVGPAATKTTHRTNATNPRKATNQLAPGKTARSSQASVFLPPMVNETRTPKLDRQGILLLLLVLHIYLFTIVI